MLTTRVDGLSGRLDRALEAHGENLRASTVTVEVGQNAGPRVLHLGRRRANEASSRSSG